MISSKFQKAIDKIKNLEKYKRYVGAFIFGSVARNEITKNSDLDIKIIINEDSPCKEISHPFINGIKLDISFVSLNQLEEQTRKPQDSPRIPMIAESIIIFDKTGKLTELKEYYSKIKPPKFTEKDHRFQKFMIYHANDKVERNLEDDPGTALLSMHIGINDLLKTHYSLNGKWWVSDKRIFSDLDSWDKSLTDLLSKFLNTQQVKEKFKIWSEIIDHVSIPMGGRGEIEENNCKCEICQKDLQQLLSE